jgi:signal transduction histidine kinase
MGPAWRVAIAPDAARLDALDRLRPRGWLAVPLVARGQVLGVLSFVMAASRRAFTPLVVAVAEELARRAALSADNARLYRQAVRASEAKSAFLGTISHELRTPLTAIIGYAELLQDGLAGPLAEPQAEFVRRIRESSDHLLRLVEEVLRYTRLQAQEEQPVLARVDVGALAEQSLAVVVPLAHRKGLALHLDRPDAPVWLDTDATKLRQILVNLLGNAVKFTDHGEVRVRVLPPRRDDDPVTLEVADTGIGIPAALLPHVFDPFWQAEQTTTRLRGGAGLGLSVARQLARLLGGELTAESEPGRGSRFRVRLPATTPRPE